MRENTHPLDQEEVMAYLDGELPAEEATKASEHLRDCRECQELAADLQGVTRHLAAWQITRAEAGMTPAIISALQQHEFTLDSNSKRGASFWRNRFGFAVAMPRWAWVASVPALILLAIAGLLTTERYSAVRQGANAIALESPEASPAVSESSRRAMRQTGSAERAQLRAMQSQMASNLEINTSRTVAPTPPAMRAMTADDSGAMTSASTLPPTMIARTAQLTIVVKDFDTSQKRLEEILKLHGGYLGEMTTTAPEAADRKLSATLRVPSSQLDSAIAQVKELGHVESESQSGEEVTSQYIDLQARLTNARNTEQRLTELLRRQTGKLDEVVTVEEKISEVREQIERMEAEQKNLGERVDFGTLSVSLTEQRKTQLQVVPPSVGTQIHNAAVEGYGSVVDGVIGLLVFLMSWGPSLLLWGAILFFPVRFVWRRLRREAV